jgi:pimeloyl-ACP methyl ester carboxylesterase
MLRFLIVALALVASLARAADRLVTIETRPGVKVGYYWMERPDAKATIVLLPGGEGGLGMKDGVPMSQNFLTRSRDLFAAAGYNVAAVGKPSDHNNLDSYFRSTDDHIADLRAVVEKLREFGKPVWLVGTSLGTISAAAVASAQPPVPLAGIVLTSSVTTTTRSVRFTVPMLPLANVKVPVLVMHHKNDQCPACEPGQAHRILDAMPNAPVKKLLFVEGGDRFPTGDPCEALHFHGYIGMEKEAVGQVTGWIANPAP